MKTDFDIIAIRKSRGWTQIDLAEYLGVDRTTVSRIESGKEASGPVKKLLRLLIQENLAPAKEQTNA